MKYALALLAVLTPQLYAQTYWPGTTWERRTPNPKIEEAIAFAKANEHPDPRDLEHAHNISAFGREPFSVRVDRGRPRCRSQDDGPLRSRC